MTAPVPIADRVQVAVVEDILETYVGEYEFSPAASLFVSLADGALFARLTGQGTLPIFPESESEFFYRVVDAQLSFMKNDSGVVTGLILHQNGADQPARKVSGEVPDLTGGRIEVEVAESILETYVGEYELVTSVIFAVTLEDGALFGEAQGLLPRFAMLAESETEFFVELLGIGLTFQRDTDGVVTGLILEGMGQTLPGQKVR